MVYIETAAAASIFAVSDRALRIAAQRNSKKYTCVRLENTNTRSRGGVKLLFGVSIDRLKEAIGSGLVSRDIDVWGESLRELSIDEISSGDDSVASGNFNLNLERGARDESDYSSKGELLPDICKSEYDRYQERPFLGVGKRVCGRDERILCGQGRLVGDKRDRVATKALKKKTKKEKQKVSNLPATKLNKHEKHEVLEYAAVHGVKAAALEFGVSDKSIYRWLKSFKKDGIKALKDKRGKRTKADMRAIKDAILTIGSAQATSWWREYVRRYSVKKGLSFDLFTNSYELKADISRSTFLRHAKVLVKDDFEVRAYLRGGLDTLGDGILSIKRDYLKTNEEWQVDATKFDFMCLDENGQAKRYTAVGIVDVASGARVYDLFDSANSYANVRLLKKAFLKMGRPGYIKGDNGKDYVGEHFQGVLKRLGITYVNAPPFKGNAKGKIERSHGVLQNSHEALSGFIGHNAGQRIRKEGEALEKSKRLSGVQTNIENLLSKDEMQAMIDSWCDGFSRSEIESFMFDERVFGKSFVRLLQAEGFSVEGHKYISLEIYKHAKLGDECELIQDIDDASKFYVYKDGVYLCEVANDEINNLSVEEVKKAKKEYTKANITPAKVHIKSLKNEKDAHYKALAQAKLEESIKNRREVIKKPKSEKKKEQAQEKRRTIYLPDIDEAIEKFG